MRMGGSYGLAGVTMKRITLIALCFCLVARSTSDVQANPLARAFTTLVINQTIALVTQKAVQRDGVKPDDPMLDETHRAMSLVATEYAQQSVNERFLMAANGPTWFGLASVLLGSQLGQIASAKIEDKKVTISATPDGSVEVTHEWHEPAEKVWVPTYTGSTSPAAKQSPWAAVAATGARVYADRDCDTAECALFPKESWGNRPRPDELYRGWFELKKSNIVAYAENWAQVNAYLLAYAQAALIDEGKKFRNLHVDVPDHNKEKTGYQSYFPQVSYEYEECKDVVERRLDFSNPACTKERQESPSVSKDYLCTSEYETKQCDWKSSFESFSSISLPSISRVIPTFRPGPRKEREVYDSLDEAFDGLTDDEKRLELNPGFVANVANALVSKASQRRDYAGVPHSVTSPITPQDVKALTDERGRELAPRVVDVFSRPMDEYERVVPISVSVVPDRIWPGTRVWPGDRGDPRDRERPYEPDRERPADPLSRDVNVVNRPTVDIGNAITVDLGTAPQVATPTLEDPPTAAMILDPILKLVPGFKDWKTPKYKAQCPRPSFELFSTMIRMDAMCDLAEKSRPTLHAIMLTVFVLAAVVIVLAA